jgi:uridine kinase
LSTPVSIVRTDNFFRPSSERTDKHAILADLDWKRLRDQVLIPLHCGESAHFQLYDWPEDRLKDWMTISAGGVAIIDGIVSTRRELATYYDLRIWLSCPRDIRVGRLLDRGDTSAREIKSWLPSEDRYIASHHPEARAHLVIDTTASTSSEDGSRWFVKRWSPPRAAQPPAGVP